VEEADLTAAARAGNQDALADLFRESRPQIEAVGSEVFRGPGSKENLEDFCSDVWLLAIRFLGNFRADCSFTTWIVKIARHRALAILTKRAQPKNGDRRLVYQSCETSDQQWENEYSAAEDGRLGAATASMDIERLLETLCPGQRELVQLHHLDGLTETEIADRTGLTVRVVRGRLWRVMVELRKKVEKGAYRNSRFSL
jgi:RNA polymerase sigma-70 factor (ECF subfamily)